MLNAHTHRIFVFQFQWIYTFQDISGCHQGPWDSFKQHECQTNSLKPFWSVPSSRFVRTSVAALRFGGKLFTNGKVQRAIHSWQRRVAFRNHRGHIETLVSIDITSEHNSSLWPQQRPIDEKTGTQTKIVVLLEQLQDMLHPTLRLL